MLFIFGNYTVSEQHLSRLLAVSRRLGEALGSQIASPRDNRYNSATIRWRAIQYRERASERVLRDGDPQDWGENCCCKEHYKKKVTSYRNMKI